MLPKDTKMILQSSRIENKILTAAMQVDEDYRKFRSNLVAGDTYKRSFNVLKRGSGIIVSMLEQPNSELMSRYGVKALSQFTQATRQRLTL